MSSNLVLFSHGQVQKRYRSRILHDREHAILTMLSGTGLVPEIKDSGENTITMTFVEGPTLLELLEKVWAGDRPTEEGERLLSLLTDWLWAAQKRLSEKTGRTVALEDPHLRNFILNKSGGALVGIDFEHWHYGVPEETPAMLLAFLNGYRGVQSKKAKGLYDRFCRELIVRLSLEPSVLFQMEERFRRCLSLRRSVAAPLRDTTAVILAGGSSSRMGQPKGELRAGGYTFLERMLYTLDSFNHVAVSVGEAPYPKLTVPVWDDILPDCGPIGGLLTALSCAKTPLVFLTACDMPDLTERLIHHLYEAFLPEDECLVPVTNGWIHPLTAIYRTGLLSRVDQLVRSGDHKILSLFTMARTHYLPLGEDFSAQLLNINTPLEYDAWLARQTTFSSLRIN